MVGLKKMSELGLQGFKDDRITKESCNLMNLNSDKGFKDGRIKKNV